MNEPGAELPAAGVVRVVGPEEAGAGFLVSASGLIVTCAHVLTGCAPGAAVSIEPHVARRSLSATVDLLQDPPDVAVLRLTGPVPREVLVLPLGGSPKTPQPGLRTFGYPQMRPEAGLPGELAFYGVTTAGGYDQLALRSDEATLGFSGAPIWDPGLGVVVGMIKSIARGDPGQRLSTTALGVPAEIIRDLCPELRLQAGRPYRGLEPFTEEHVEYYYGREHATSQLLASLAARDFVPVVAVSGGGKSSLLQAGLAKGLRDRPVVGLAQRIRCYLRVSGQPHAELLHSLALHGILLPQEMAAAPAQELAAAIRGAVPRAELIVVVDQLERLYTDCEDAERKRFVELLQYLATDTVKVVIGLRADFYHLALADLGERLAAGQVALAPMTEQDLDRAIAAPAEKLLRSFQPGLTQRLIADVRGRPGDLPLLQFALTELWEHDAAGGVLTEQTYRDLGVELPDGTHLPGAQGALIRRAEQLWQDLEPADRLRLQRILLGLIAAQPVETSGASPVAGARDLSRPARLAQWDEEDQRLVQRLIDARLLTADKAPAGGQPTVEVSHEALLRAWPRLQGWLKERNQFVQWRAQDLAPNLERWLDSNKNPEFLLPRSLLDPALQWLNDCPDELVGPPADYIQASKRRRTRRRSLVSGAVAVLVVASLAAAGIFYSLQETAVQQRDQAIYNQVVAEALQFGTSNTPLAAQLTLAAYRMQPTQDMASRLLNTENTPLSRPLNFRSLNGIADVNAVAFSPGGRTLASGNADGTVRLWDVADPAHSRPLGQPLISAGVVNAVAFSPDGRTLASGSGDAKVHLWNVADPAHSRPLGRPLTGVGAVYAVAFSPDGGTLASGNTDGTIQLWDVADPAHPRPLGRPLTSGGVSNVVTKIAFSPGGRTLASGNYDGTIRLWDVADPAHPRPLSQPLTSDSDVNAVAFSPGGRTLASGNNDGTIRVWDVADPAHPRPLGQPLTSGNGAVYAVAFSPGGGTLASGNNDGTIQLRNVADLAHPRPLGQPLTSGSDNSVFAVAFSPDGGTLASGYRGGTIRLWSLPLTVLTSGNGAVNAVAFSPGGRTLASGNNDGTIQLRNVADPAHPRPLGQPLTDGNGAVNAVAFSPGGRTLASGNNDGTIRLWDVADPAHPRPFGQPLIIGRRVSVTAMAFSPDGRTLASSGGDVTVRLWDVADPAHPRPLGQPLTGDNGVVNAVTFSPDGRTLASGSASGTVHLWNVADPAHPRPFGQPLTSGSSVSVSVTAVAFSADGRTLASGYLGGTFRLWDVAAPAHSRPLGQPLSSGSSVSVNAVAFSSDGYTLASGNNDGTIQLWNVADPAHPRPLGQPLSSGSSGSVNAVAFSSDGYTLASGDEGGITQLWNLNVHNAIERICITAGYLTLPQWHEYIPQSKYLPGCVALS